MACIVNRACKINTPTERIFQEAIHHCRWKKVLRTDILSRPEFQEATLKTYSDKSFDEILIMVHSICNNIYGIGMLATYDITSAICRYNNIVIDKVYIIGNGPKRAIKLLHIIPQLYKNKHVTLKYVNISELRNAFHAKHYNIDSCIAESNNGDHWESYICNWQKTV